MDRNGNIVGHGHAKRDTVEWLLPPLWHWKVLTLPARGPRPALKGEELITLRLMNDVEIPSTISASSSDRPPYAYRPKSSDASTSLGPQRQLVPQSTSIVSGITYAPPSVPPLANESGIAYTLLPQLSPAGSNAVSEHTRLTLIALRPDTILAVTSYRIDSDEIHYTRPSGLTGSVNVGEVDWRKTSQLNTDASRRYAAH